LLNPKTASEYAYFLFAVKNAQEYNQGKVKDFSEVGVKLLDPMTLEVTLNKPKAFFPMLLTHQSTYPILKDIVSKHGDQWTAPEKIATLGRYKLKIWEHDKALVLEKNDQFFGTPANIPFILCRMILEQSTAISLFDAGKLDILKTLPSVEIKKLKARPEYRKVDLLYTYFYGFNVRKPPFNNVKVRKAFASAVDRNEMVNLIGGDRFAMFSWIPKGMFGHDENIGLKFDPAKAKAYLKEAGFEDPKKFPKTAIGFNTNEDHKRIAENVQAQLKRNLGIEVELKNEEWKVYLSSLRVDPPNMYRMGWVADYPDPDNYMTLMTSYSENNRTGWKNKEYDSLVEAGAAELDPAKRREIYTKAHKILMEDEVPAMPFYTGIAQYLISGRVKNFPMNAMDDTNYGLAEIAQ
jgi:oligopeptide transport system substrate-binding protein